MKKAILLSLLLASATPTIFAQQTNNAPETRNESFERPQAPASTFQQVDKIRKALNLDQKQFEKVYKAYESYNKAIFGDSNQASPSGMGRPRGGMGGPGGGMGGPGGGMGGPGGGMGGPGGGMGGPGGGMGPGGEGERPDMAQGDSRQAPPKEMSQKDIEKLQKKMKKQEEKLSKSVRKAIKDDATYAQWQEMRQRELMPPRPEDKH